MWVYGTPYNSEKSGVLGDFESMGRKDHIPWMVMGDLNEFLGNMKKKEEMNSGGIHEAGLKIDMNKAYDRIERDFLEAVMIKMGFARVWIDLIMNCISTVSFAVIVNGQPGKFFKPTRGLRQGDPLSPYLFLLVSEALSRNLSSAVHNGEIKGVRIARRCLMISHLFLPTTLLLFVVRAPIRTQNTISERERRHESNSQCTMDFGILRSFGLPKLHSKFRRSRKKSGKEVLLKAVATAVPAFPMACFRFPEGTCNQINSALASFWWGNNEENAGIHWKSWKKLCLAKKVGVWGFRDLSNFNLALLAKQSWRIILNPQAAWVKILKARYFPTTDFLHATKDSRPSWAWVSLLEGRNAMMKEAPFQIFSGANTNIWNDVWIPSCEPGPVQTLLPIPHQAPQLVQELMDKWNHTWKLDSISTFINNDFLQSIRCIPIGHSSRPDRLVWPWNSSGSYTVKSGYHCFHARQNTDIASHNHTSRIVSERVWKTIWKVETLPKIKLFIWRALSGSISTKLVLFKRKIATDPICPICEGFEESVKHILFLCPWTQLVWFGSYLSYKVEPRRISTLDRWLEGIMSIPAPGTCFSASYVGKSGRQGVITFSMGLALIRGL
ncbi:hypothetical protein Prudu_017055 [Prunus dulcis]|uniref:Reverse transcriptase domain-containing protein n=1 Tax=Prunus dulcis TaxID=3755 RepID=A0A4Y1RMJ7_PRUDU|nr:hypothetical protein Prudu_017055 [Prunus dulcis]